MFSFGVIVCHKTKFGNNYVWTVICLLGYHSLFFSAICNLPLNYITIASSSIEGYVSLNVVNTIAKLLSLCFDSGDINFSVPVSNYSQGGYDQGLYQKLGLIVNEIRTIVLDHYRNPLMPCLIKCFKRLLKLSN